jgi:hypothetical protein
VELRRSPRRRTDDGGQTATRRAAAEGWDADFLRTVAEAVVQLLMESDVEGLIGAGRQERSPERLN